MRAVKGCQILLDDMMEKAQPGHTVKFQGLTGAAHLNNTKGTLVRFLKKEQRWAVRCHVGGEVVNAKPANLELQNRSSASLHLRPRGEDEPAFYLTPDNRLHQHLEAIEGIDGIVSSLDALLVRTKDEVRGVELFSAPQREECPLCFEILPVDPRDTVYSSCCGKLVCNGCIFAHSKTASGSFRNLDIVLSCAFCRSETPSSGIPVEEELQLELDRMKSGDPLAFFRLHSRYSRGDGVAQDEQKGLELLTRAAELGHSMAFWYIAEYYYIGAFVEPDREKERSFLELAIKKGCVQAHFTLGEIEMFEGNIDAGLKHFAVAAGEGMREALESIERAVKNGKTCEDVLSKAAKAFYEARQDELSENRLQDAIMQYHIMQQ